LDRLGHYESAAKMCAFAATPFSGATYPELVTTIAHIREVLGDECFESLSTAGESMTNANIVTYALEQIDLARADLLQAGKSP
jgi:hypothetical protein